jgi:hypothetical protein
MFKLGENILMPLKTEEVAYVLMDFMRILEMRRCRQPRLSKV